MESKQDELVGEINDLITAFVDTQTQLDHRLHAVEKEIDKLFTAMKACGSVDDASQIFVALGIYQSTLSRLVFKYEYTVSAKLRTFITDFDRTDDPDLRRHLFAKIQSA